MSQFTAAIGGYFDRQDPKLVIAGAISDYLNPSKILGALEQLTEGYSSEPKLKDTVSTFLSHQLDTLSSHGLKYNQAEPVDKSPMKLDITGQIVGFSIQNSEGAFRDFIVGVQNDAAFVGANLSNNDKIQSYEKSWNEMTVEQKDNAIVDMFTIIKDAMGAKDIKINLKLDETKSGFGAFHPPKGFEAESVKLHSDALNGSFYDVIETISHELVHSAQHERVQELRVQARNGNLAFRNETQAIEALAALNIEEQFYKHDGEGKKHDIYQAQPAEMEAEVFGKQVSQQIAAIIKHRNPQPYKPEPNLADLQPEPADRNSTPFPSWLLSPTTILVLVATYAALIFGDTKVEEPPSKDKPEWLQKALDKESKEQATSQGQHFSK